MFYERKIIYLDMLVDGKRQGSAGFWKLEARDSICNMTIQVMGVRGVGGVCCPIYLVGNGSEKELGKIEISAGRGSVQIRGTELGNLCGSKISYESLEMIRIPIADRCEIRGVLRKVVSARLPETASEVIRETLYETVNNEPDNIVIEMPEAVNMEAHDESKSTEIVEKFEEALVAEAKQITEEVPQQDPVQESFPQNKNMRLQDTKWKQLCEIYPRITPFRDEREYLSVGPNDFVLLPSKYFGLVHNSFLLHGYYNYKHLVLKEIQNRNETRYYIGVPGTFFDREKQVAVMFGFESFECMEEPAKSGDFGYYLMRIEL